MNTPVELAADLATRGSSAEERARIVQACLAFEDLPENRGTQVRDEVTGPIVDALHADAGVLRKELANGLLFDFLYRSKIARDFVLSVPAIPNHVWEPQTTKTLLHFARGAQDAIVGGAYFGDHAILIAHAMRDAGARCHAFEPDLAQAAMLAQNASLNGLDNVVVDTRALWSDESTRLEFVGHDALARLVPAASGAVRATTIDAYLDRAGVERVGLIMLDLEGGELAALRGAARRLAMPRDAAPVVVFELHRQFVDWSAGIQATEVGAMLQDHGYTLFAIRDFQSNIDMSDRPVELVTADSAYLGGPPHGFNVLAAKDVSIVDSEHFRIVTHVSPKLLRHGDPALHHPIGGL